MILTEWPWAESDPHTRITIMLGVNCLGQRGARELDIVVLAQAAGRAALSVRRAAAPPMILPLLSLCLVIEIKETPTDKVRFVGSGVMVSYADGERNASHQSEQQKYALAGFVEARGVFPPLVCNVLWLRRVGEDVLPPRPRRVVGMGITWAELLAGAVEAMPETVRLGRDGRHYISAYPLDLGYDLSRVAGALIGDAQPPAFTGRERYVSPPVRDDLAGRGRSALLFGLLGLVWGTGIVLGPVAIFKGLSLLRAISRRGRRGGRLAAVVAIILGVIGFLWAFYFFFSLLSSLFFRHGRPHR